MNTSLEQATLVEDFSTVDREGHIYARTIKESIYIRVNDPTLNRNIGKYNNLSTYLGQITTAELKIKNQQEQQESQGHNTMQVSSRQKVCGGYRPSVPRHFLYTWWGHLVGKVKICHPT